jgi:hypothetical protein
MNRALATLVGLLAVVALPWFRPLLPLPEWRRGYVSLETPVQAVSALQSLAQPMRLFNEVGYGSYLIWSWPEVPVFIDTRVELYPPEQWADYIAVSQARYDWEAILDRYGVDTLIVDRVTQQPLVEGAAADEDWTTLYEDERTLVFRGAAQP